MLIAFEGIDGSGKSTQAAMLADDFRREGREVIFTREPTHGPHGTAIRQSFTTGRLSAQQELDLLVADRREHVEQLIAPALARGAVVVIDRYYYSTVAYQASRGLDPKAVLELNRSFAPKPSLVFLVDLDPRVALERISARAGGRDLVENLDEQLRVREAFLRLASTEPHFVVIDGALGVEAMHASIRSRLSAWRSAAATSRPS